MHKIVFSAFVLSLFAATQAFATGAFVVVVSKATGGSSSSASASASVKATSSGGTTTTVVTYSGKSSGGGGVRVFGSIHDGCSSAASSCSVLSHP